METTKPRKTTRAKKPKTTRAKEPKTETRSQAYHPSNHQVTSLFQSADSEGPTVNENTAFNLTTVWAAVRCISETIAGLPLVVRTDPDAGSTRAVGHPLYTLLHDQPNYETTSFIWRETLQAHLLTWGNAYCEIERNHDGEIIGLWQLRPDLMTVFRDQATKQICYRYTTNSGSVILDASEVLHIPGLGFDGVYGYSPIMINAKAIGLGLSAQNYGSNFFNNSAVPSVILQYPGLLGTDGRDNLRQSWDEMSKGRKTGVLEEGVVANAVGIPPEDSQFLETRKFQVTEIARIFRVPAHKIGDLERATFSNIEQQSLEFVQDCILPWCRRWESELKRKLLQGTPYTVEFVLDGLLRADLNTRYNSYQIGRNAGFLSVNEIRRLENQPPIEGGNTYLLPSNMNLVDADGTVTNLAAKDALQTPTDEPETTIEEEDQAGGQGEQQRALQAFLPILITDLQRLHTKEANAVSRLLDKPDSQTRAAEFYQQHKNTLFEAIQPVFVGLSTVLGLPDPGTWLEQRCEEMCGAALLDVGDEYETRSRTRYEQLQTAAEQLITSYLHIGGSK